MTALYKTSRSSSDSSSALTSDNDSSDSGTNNNYIRRASLQPTGTRPDRQLSDIDIDCNNHSDSDHSFMGRKKINIVPITHSKNRLVTFNKRKVGLMKKAMELSILCECDIGLIILPKERDCLYQYSTYDEIDILLNEFYSYSGPAELLTNNELDKLNPGKASSFRAVMRQPKYPNIQSINNALSNNNNNNNINQSDVNNKKRKHRSNNHSINNYNNIPVKQEPINDNNNNNSTITIGDQTFTAQQLAHLNPQTIANIQQISAMLDKGTINHNNDTNNKNNNNITAVTQQSKHSAASQLPLYKPVNDNAVVLTNPYINILQQHSNGNAIASLYSPHTSNNNQTHPLKYNNTRPQNLSYTMLPSPLSMNRTLGNTINNNTSPTIGARALSHDAVLTSCISNQPAKSHSPQPATAPPINDDTYTQSLNRSIDNTKKPHRSSSRVGTNKIITNEEYDHITQLQSSPDSTTIQPTSSLSQRVPFKVSLTIPGDNNSTFNNETNNNNISDNITVQPLMPSQPVYGMNNAMPYSTMISPQFTSTAMYSSPYMQLPLYATLLDTYNSSQLYQSMRTPATNMYTAMQTPLFQQNQSPMMFALDQHSNLFHTNINNNNITNDYNAPTITPIIPNNNTNTPTLSNTTNNNTSSSS